MTAGRASGLVGTARRRAKTVRDMLGTARATPAVDGRPLVSVVLATYNWSNVLRHAIHSVLWQTYPHLELLVIGDGCTDDSEEVVASFGDERVRWHNLEANTGSQAIPNNTGLELARGQYVAYQGHDDVWHPSHLATVLSHLQRDGADFAYSLAEVLGPPRSRVRYLTGLVRPAEMRLRTWLPPTSIVHRAELTRRIGGWRTWQEGGAPDIDFVDRVQESGARLIRVPALTAFKFPSSYRKNSYRDRPSHEQAAYVRRIGGERFFIERELAGLARRRLSPLKSRPTHTSESDAELDSEAMFALLRRIRGLD